MACGPGIITDPFSDRRNVLAAAHDQTVYHKGRFEHVPGNGGSGEIIRARRAVASSKAAADDRPSAGISSLSVQIAEIIG
jgi:hypothetical protein